METLVLPPQDQLAQRHYWHNTVVKDGGFPPSNANTTQIKKAFNCKSIFTSNDTQLNSNQVYSHRTTLDRDALPSSDGSHGLLPLPLCNSPLESFTNTPDSFYNHPFSPVASSVPRSAGYLSSSMQPRQSPLHFRDPAVNTRSLPRSENEPVYRPASSSGRYCNQSKQEEMRDSRMQILKMHTQGKDS
ncbi:hypothetical protein O6H91_Y186600 [Diphasiastrum complanatum]|nr:hypothetical protein O6H91_Y186600 [Diphasiastrum complanatum]